MIGVLLLSASFMTLVMVAILILAFNLKTWVHRRDEINQKKIDDLKSRVDETQDLFKKEITGLLNDFRNVIDK